MKIAIGADHAGFVLKDRMREKLIRDGHEVADLGTQSTDSCDYPDFAQAVAREVAAGRCDRGILVCYTGIGMAIAANKVAGVRAAPVQGVEEALLARQHNDANVLTMGAHLVSPERAAELVDIFLATEFQGGRHARRVAKIAQLERAAGWEGAQSQ